MSLAPQQKFMGQIMGPSSNFNNVLVYHGLGSGKSCTSIVLGEALKNSTSSRIIYSVPAPLIDQYFEVIAGEIRNGKFFSCPSFCVTKNSDNELKRDFYVSETKNKTLVEMQKKMQELGAPVLVAAAACALCGSEALPTNAMVYFSSANPVDMGKALDIFSSDEMQRWMFSNMAPHANFTDQGIVVFND